MWLFQTKYHNTYHHRFKPKVILSKPNIQPPFLFSKFRATCYHLARWSIGVVWCRYEERDVFVSRSHLQDLVERLMTPPPLPLPLVFLHGELLGVSNISLFEKNAASAADLVYALETQSCK
jgi:hypothetical protein